MPAPLFVAFADGGADGGSADDASASPSASPPSADASRRRSRAGHALTRQELSAIREQDKLVTQLIGVPLQLGDAERRRKSAVDMAGRVPSVAMSDEQLLDTIAKQPALQRPNRSPRLSVAGAPSPTHSTGGVDDVEVLGEMLRRKTDYLNMVLRREHVVQIKHRENAARLQRELVVSQQALEEAQAQLRTLSLPESVLRVAGEAFARAQSELRGVLDDAVRRRMEQEAVAGRMRDEHQELQRRYQELLLRAADTEEDAHRLRRKVGKAAVGLLAPLRDLRLCFEGLREAWRESSDLVPAAVPGNCWMELSAAISSITNSPAPPPQPRRAHPRTPRRSSARPRHQSVTSPTASSAARAARVPSVSPPTPSSVSPARRRSTRSPRPEAQSMAELRARLLSAEETVRRQERMAAELDSRRRGDRALLARYGELHRRQLAVAERVAAVYRTRLQRARTVLADLVNAQRQPGIQRPLSAGSPIVVPGVGGGAGGGGGGVGRSGADRLGAEGAAMRLRVCLADLDQVLRDPAPTAGAGGAEDDPVWGEIRRDQRLLSSGIAAVESTAAAALPEPLQQWVGTLAADALTPPPTGRASTDKAEAVDEPADLASHASAPSDPAAVAAAGQTAEAAAAGLPAGGQPVGGLLAAGGLAAGGLLAGGLPVGGLPVGGQAGGQPPGGQPTGGQPTGGQPPGGQPPGGQPPANGLGPGSVQPVLEVGGIVCAARGIVFKNGRKVRAGEFGVVTKVPGDAAGSPAEVDISGVVFDARPGDLLPLSHRVPQEPPTPAPAASGGAPGGGEARVQQLAFELAGRDAVIAELRAELESAQRLASVPAPGAGAGLGVGELTIARRRMLARIGRPHSADTAAALSPPKALGCVLPLLRAGRADKQIQTEPAQQQPQSRPLSGALRAPLPRRRPSSAAGGGLPLAPGPRLNTRPASAPGNAAKRHRADCPCTVCTGPTGLPSPAAALGALEREMQAAGTFRRVYAEEIDGPDAEPAAAQEDAVRAHVRTLAQATASGDPVHWVRPASAPSAERPPVAQRPQSAAGSIAPRPASAPPRADATETPLLDDAKALLALSADMMVATVARNRQPPHHPAPEWRGGGSRPSSATPPPPDEARPVVPPQRWLLSRLGIDTDPLDVVPRPAAEEVGSVREHVRAVRQVDWTQYVMQLRRSEEGRRACDRDALSRTRREAVRKCRRQAEWVALRGAAEVRKAQRDATSAVIAATGPQRSAGGPEAAVVQWDRDLGGFVHWLERIAAAFQALLSDPQRAAAAPALIAQEEEEAGDGEDRPWPTPEALLGTFEALYSRTRGCLVDSVMLPADRGGADLLQRLRHFYRDRERAAGKSACRQQLFHTPVTRGKAEEEADVQEAVQAARRRSAAPPPCMLQAPPTKVQARAPHSGGPQVGAIRRGLPGAGAPTAHLSDACQMELRGQPHLRKRAAEQP